MNVHYWRLVWAGTRRKPTRTALLAIQVTVAFTLFGLLQGLLTAVHDAVERMRPDVLVVRGATDGGPLPLGMYEQLRRIDGVVDVTYLSGLPGTYISPDEHVFAIATQIEPWVRVAPGFYVSPDAIDALKRMRTGALVSTAIAKHYGWHIGDRIVLESDRYAKTDGSTGWPFDIVGTFEMDAESLANEFLIINWDYLNEFRIDDRNLVRGYYVKATSPEAAPKVADSIDRRFSNSKNETQTESMREEGERNMRTVGDVGFLVRSVLMAVFFSLLISIGALLIQSVRERHAEIGILKTIGFNNGQVYRLILVEAVAICSIPAILGLTAASFLMPLTKAYTQLDLAFPPRVFLIGLGLALVVAVVTATVPAARAAKLTIVEALGRG